MLDRHGYEDVHQEVRSSEARQQGEAAELGKRIAAIGAGISDAELARIPIDAARNLDHYLYGAPKQD